MCLPGTGLFGVATPRALGSQPARNRQKRRARAAWTVLGKESQLTLGAYDWVASVKTPIKQAAFPELVKELEDLSRELHERWTQSQA